MRDRLTGPKLVQIIIVMTILVLAFLFRTYWYEPDTGASEQENIAFCDIYHKKCTMEQAGFSAEARLYAETLSAETPFTLEVQFSDPEVKVKRSVLEGETMYMGTLPALLREESPGLWRGQALVGACTESRMRWAWVLEVEFEGQSRQLRFLFEVSH